MERRIFRALPDITFTQVSQDRNRHKSLWGMGLGGLAIIQEETNRDDRQRHMRRDSSFIGNETDDSMCYPPFMFRLLQKLYD